MVGFQFGFAFIRKIAVLCILTCELVQSNLILAVFSFTWEWGGEGEGEGDKPSLGLTDKWSKYSLTNWLTTRTNEFKTAALKNVKAGYIRKWNIKLLERYFDKYYSDQSWTWNKLHFYSEPKFFLHQKSEIWRIWWHIQSEDSCALLVFDTSRGGPVVVGGTRAVPCNQVAPTLLCSALLSFALLQLSSSCSL